MGMNIREKERSKKFMKSLDYLPGFSIEDLRRMDKE